MGSLERYTRTNWQILVLGAFKQVDILISSNKAFSYVYYCILCFLHLNANRYAAYVFNGYKSKLNWKCNAIMKYTNPCKGCSHCYSKDLSNTQSMNSNRRWWHVFLPKRQIFISGKEIFIRFGVNYSYRMLLKSK